MSLPPTQYKGARVLLLGGGLLNLILYGIPLLFVPDRWAETLQWTGDVSNPLAVYLGRSLGATSIVFSLGAFWAARDPYGHRIVLKMTATVCVILAAIHVYGAILEDWPFFETVEIFLWSALAALSARFYPRRGPDPSGT